MNKHFRRLIAVVLLVSSVSWFMEKATFASVYRFVQFYGLRGIYVQAMRGNDAIWRLIIMVLAALFAIYAFLPRANKTKEAVHTHDRIDHSKDLEIDHNTGKAVNRSVQAAEPHSAREHWKRQLDAMLENGTIDRSEYRSMMNRKF